MVKKYTLIISLISSLFSFTSHAEGLDDYIVGVSRTDSSITRVALSETTTPEILSQLTNKELNPQYQSIEILDLSTCNSLTNNDITLILNLPKIKTVYLNPSRITEVEAHALYEYFKIDGIKITFSLEFQGKPTGSIFTEVTETK